MSSTQIDISDMSVSMFDLNKENLINKATKLLYDKKPDFQKYIMTLRGNNIIKSSKVNKVMESITNIEDISVKMDDLLLPKNINFINIFNAKDKIVGICIDTKQISYGNPLIISIDTLGCSTVLHTIKNDLFYAYYSGKDLSSSISGIIEVHKELTKASLSRVIHSSQNSIEHLLEVFNSYYDKSVINYNSTESIIIPINITKVSLFQYNTATSGYIGVGQSYALLSRKYSKRMIAKNYSQNYSIIKNNTVMSMILDADKEFELNDI